MSEGWLETVNNLIRQIRSVIAPDALLPLIFELDIIEMTDELADAWNFGEQELQILPHSTVRRSAARAQFTFRLCRAEKTCTINKDGIFKVACKPEL